MISFLAVLLVVTASGCGSAEPVGGALPSRLRVGVVPNVSPEKQRALYEPLRAYLADRLGVEVELFVANNYAGVVAGLVAKQVDVAYLGGLTYTQAAEQSPGVVPLVTEVDEETGTPRYWSAVVVRAAAPPGPSRTLSPLADGSPSGTWARRRGASTRG
ncbi:hypothetical protein GCM10027614_80870 [Micromonospora vulcania]